MQIRDGVVFSDGWAIFREWLGPKTRAVAIVPRRLYFEKGRERPSDRPERELAGANPPPLLPPAQRLAGCLRLAEQLGRHAKGFCPEPMRVARSRSDLHQKTSLVFGNGARAAAGQKVGSLLGRHGCFQVPEGFGIVIAAEDLKDQRVREYQQEIQTSMVRCGMRSNVDLTTHQRLHGRLGALENGADKRTSPMALLIAISGKRGEPLPPQVGSLLPRMEALNIPFRLFSVDNASMKWSAFDQLGSLLQAAGGTPYVLELPWPEQCDPPFILGVDLGHPLAIRESWVTLSLLDHRGVHLESWRCRQSRDETIRARTLAAGLTWTAAAMERHAAKEQGLLVVRDGRLHEGETIATYRRLLRRPMTFVELTKRQTPEMFTDLNEPKPAPAGSECLVEGSATPFIAPIGPRLRNDLSHVFKLHVRPGADDMGLGMDRISEIVTGLSYSPALGLQPHALPGPIYWADGIAAIGETNHQFSGQRITLASPVDVATAPTEATLA